METQVIARNNVWLAKRLSAIWDKHFPDVPVANTVYVRFGRSARTRLGSIKFGRRRENPTTYITVTGYFRDPAIPEFVVDAVLAHELSHYAHGFFSPHPRLHLHPHKHSIVDKELTKRGLEGTMRLQKRWLKTNWLAYLRHTSY